MHAPKRRWLVCAAVLAAGCATTTTFNSTWHNPEARPITLAGQKVVVLVLTTEDRTRRTSEDLVAAQITSRGAQGVAAWTILPTADMRDEAKARAALTQSGAVGVVVMEIVPEDRNARPVDFRGSMRSASNISFWGNYRWAWGGAWYEGPPPSAGVFVETLVYSLHPDELLWAGRSRTVNPVGIPSVFAGVSAAVGEEIEKAGLLKGSGRE
jgi:hypothetical protein